MLKPVGTYEKVRDAAAGEFEKLLALRHPHVTFVYDAFEYRDTFYIVTERCEYAVTELFTLGEQLLAPMWAFQQLTVDRRERPGAFQGRTQRKRSCGWL